MFGLDKAFLLSTTIASDCLLSDTSPQPKDPKEVLVVSSSMCSTDDDDDDDDWPITTITPALTDSWVVTGCTVDATLTPSAISDHCVRRVSTGHCHSLVIAVFVSLSVCLCNVCVCASLPAMIVQSVLPLQQLASSPSLAVIN